MTKIPFSQLKVHPPYRVFRKGKDGVVSLDCESFVSGYAFLITDSLKNYSWIRSADDVVRFLTNPTYAGSFNTFWNMDFDVSVLLKWLGYEFCKTLMTDGVAHYGDVIVRYIPKRFLMLQRGRTYISYYDAMQYYIPRGLDAASQTFLGERKKVQKRKTFYESDYESADILSYCLQDSLLTAKLTELLLSDLHDMGFTPSSLSSPGTIMEEAVINHTYLPDITQIPGGALEYAYDAYEGGWMECFRRGYFPKLYDYDISSAYPYQVSELPDLNGGTFTYVKGENGHSGIGWANCTVHMESRVHPIVFRGDRNYTPMGTWSRRLSLEKVKYIRERKQGSVDVHDGWYFTPRPSARRPFAAIMRHLFKQKVTVRNRWLPKSLSVALYGKFAQRDEEGETGNLFIPPYADLITSRTRVQLANYALMLPEQLCLVAADGLTFSAPLPASALSKGFGGLRLVYCAQGVVIGTNVCTIVGKKSSGEWRPGRVDWLTMLRERPDQTVYPLDWQHVPMLKEGVVSPEAFKSVGVFGIAHFDFNINFDMGRKFIGRPSCGRDLLENTYESFPWEVGMARRRTELWELGRAKKS